MSATTFELPSTESLSGEMSAATVQQRLTVLFVGGFSVPKDSTEGGQVYACRSLLTSPISDHVDWILVDSSQASTPPPPLVARAFAAFTRVLSSLRHLCFSGVDSVLVFSSFAPLSLLEKGLICLLSRVFRKRVALSIRYHPYLPNRFRRFIRAYGRIACGCCDSVICQSQLAADDLVKLYGVDAAKTCVIHNWVDISRFSPTGRAADGRTNRPQQVVQLIYVGWLYPRKGVEYLLQAIRLLVPCPIPFHLQICGSGPQEADMVGLAKRLNIESQISFMGWVPNEQLRDHLVAADIFVLPSLREGMPNAVLQAMACGLPVVATSVSSIPAVVTEGVNGFLVPPRSPQDLADAILRLLEDGELRREMGRRNSEQIRAHHNIDLAWPRIAEVLVPGKSRRAISQMVTEVKVDNV